MDTSDTESTISSTTSEEEISDTSSTQSFEITLNFTQVPAEDLQ